MLSGIRRELDQSSKLRSSATKSLTANCAACKQRLATRKKP